MPTLRRGGREGNLAARPGRPEILLTSDSPYGSRRLAVEYDGVHHRRVRVRPDGRDRRGLAGQSPACPGRGRPGAGRGGPGPGDAGRAHQASRRRPAAGPAHPPPAVVRGGGRGGPGGGRPAAGGDSRLVGHVPRDARLQPGMHRPDPVRVVPGRRDGRARPAGGPGHGLLALAGERGRVGRLPEGGPRASAGPARPGGPVLGCQRRPDAVGRGVGTAADPQPAVHRAVHARHELPADARRRAVRGGPAPPRAGSSWPWPPPCPAPRRRGSSCGWRTTPGAR